MLSLQVVAVGPCNHKEVCARCCLRMRVNYADRTCPLCKADHPEARTARWPQLIKHVTFYIETSRLRHLTRSSHHLGVQQNEMPSRVLA